MKETEGKGRKIAGQDLFDCVVFNVRKDAKTSKGESGAEKLRSESEGPEDDGRAPYMISGDNGWRVPPVPIPNTEVKPPRADGTWLETARETMSLPDSK